VFADGRPLLVYFAGAAWDGVPGTDRRLAERLGKQANVLWVDPPPSAFREFRRNGARRRLSTLVPVAAGVLRLRVVGPPGISRPGMRGLARAAVSARTRRTIRALGDHPAAVVVSSPDVRLNAVDAEVRIYYATDDFVAGAELLGYKTDYIRRTRARNLKKADLAVAVSDQLADALRSDARSVAVIANGCDCAHYLCVSDLAPSPEIVLPRPIAGLIGQLNDRLDMRILEAIADEGDSLLLVGPRYEESADTTRRLDSLISRDNVQWVGRQPFDRIPEYLAAIDVGITPYADNAFNRASFPLKTLEYLAAGRPVVSTDLPSIQAIGGEVVACVSGPGAFADAVHRMLKDPPSASAAARRQEVARRHDWSVRADELIRLIELTRTE
jgi:teichuronic acid biosynthesis glycosyltransferase TuaH